jgi:hypothetical protein
LTSYRIFSKGDNMRSKTTKTQFLTLRYQHQCQQIDVRVPWPLAIKTPTGPERFCWPFPGQERVWAYGGRVFGVLFIGDEMRAFSTVRNRDATAPINMESAIDPQAVTMLGPNRVIQNVNDRDCVQRVFNEVVRLIAQERERAEWREKRNRYAKQRNSRP